MRRPAIAAAVSLAALGGAVAFGWSAAGLIEARLRARVAVAAEAKGLDWLAIEVDGARVRLGGVAPDAAAADSAAALGAGLGGLARVETAFAVDSPAPPPAPPPPPALDILRDAAGAQLIGSAPDPLARDRLTAALGAALGAPPDARMLSVGDAVAPRDWRLLEDAAVGAALALSVGRVSLSPGRLAVTGAPVSEDARIAVERAARALAAAGLSATVDLAPPPVAAGAAVLDAALGPGGLTVAACAPPDAEAAAALDAALRAAGGAAAACRALGASSDADWRRAALAAVSALVEARAGRVRLEGRRLTLSAPQGAGVAAARLAAALPAGFALSVEGAGAPAPAPAAAAPGGAWLRLRSSPDLVVLTGAAPDAPTRQAVLSYAAAAFGADRVHDGLALAADAPSPEGWRAAALAGIEALAALERGALEVAADRVAVTGATRAPLAVHAAHAALAPPEARGWTVETRVTVDLPGRLSAALLGPTACAARLSEVAAADPIRFPPGESAIDAGSAPTLEALAAVLRRCAEGAIEVGGHTDSQGSAGYNLALSQARAEAVRAALIERGAPPAMLSARGYGPGAPVADNDTEAGRARNRRIAFEVRAGTGAGPAGGPTPDDARREDTP
jgi:OOP family OmpA-OmpF porin